MIYVDALRPRKTPSWMGPVTCHMISDRDRDDLEGFAASIGMPNWWLRYVFFPHFELSPKYRAKALGAGAIDCRGVEGAKEFARAMQRYVDAHPFVIPRLD
jgi:Protein of unknown function (DUF4031)